MLVMGRRYWVGPIQEVEEEMEGGTAKLADETIENSVEGTDPTEGGTAKLADETIENSVEGNSVEGTDPKKTAEEEAEAETEETEALIAESVLTAGTKLIA